MPPSTTESPSLYSDSLCLAFTLISVFPSFLYFTYLSLFLSPLSIFVAFAFSLLPPGFHYLFLCPHGVCLSCYPFIFLAVNILSPLP